jgi:hypothetical protein
VIPLRGKQRHRCDFTDAAAFKDAHHVEHHPLRS